MKRSLFLGLAAVAVMVTGITGAVVWTQVAHADGEDSGTSFAARIATILELEESVVEDAFKQANNDIQDERFEAKMDRRVEDGKMTQDEADAAVEWYEERPEGINLGRRDSRTGAHQRRGPRGNFHSRGQGQTDDSTSTDDAS